MSIIVSTTWFALSRIEFESRKNVVKSLQTVVLTIQEALHIWNNQRKNDLIDITREGEVITLTYALISEHNNHQDLIKSPSLEKLRRIMIKKLKKQGGIGFFVIALDRTNIASMRDANIGSESLIHRHRKEFLQRAFAGETLFIPTIYSDVPLKTHSGELREHQPTIFVASPIRDDAGDVIAVLTFRLDPSSDFTRITQLGHIGDSGETYAFDSEGILITKSRFAHQLRRIGLIDSENEGMLSIRIANPGGNILEGFVPTIPLTERPLTLMAKSAISRQSFRNLDEYRDYRGVNVFGAWVWDEVLDIGLATEIDAKEAMRPYYETRIIIVLVLVLTITLSFALLFLMLRLEKRTKDKLITAYARLEGKVEVKTTELKESESKFRTIFESSADALMLVDETCFIDCNKATLDMFRCKSRAEFLGTHPIEWSSDKQVCSSKCIKELMKENMTTAFSRGQHTFEWNHIRADGEVFPAEVLLTSLYMNGKRIIQGTIRDISERKRVEGELASLQRKLEQFSYQDSLTGIANRRMFDQTLDREWSRSQRNQKPLSLMLIDIDFFKQFNDFYGHQQGDDCIISVARALTSISKRTSDLVARYGGEEFVILLPETEAKDARRLAGMCLHKIIEQQIPHESSKISDVVTISIGVSTIIPLLSTQPESLISAADKLLYKAKKNGRNRVECNS